jgi:hypothetical protein
MEEKERTYVEASAIEYNNNNVFAQMAARSIVEVQKRVDSIPDLLVLLEMLDYNDDIAKQNGYKDLYSLAVHIYTFIDTYYDYNINLRDEHVNSLLAPIPSLKKRIPEAFVIMFTWIGSLLLLLIIGTTLWIAGFRSPDITTMILLSTFLGLAVMEGPWQTFNLLFMSSYLQGNISGINRLLLKKMYPLDLMIIIATLTGIVIFSIFMTLPLSTMIISVAMCAGIALHKVSMMLMYALKKMSQLMVAYAGGLVMVFLMFYAFTDLVPDYLVRYGTALVVAFAVPTAFTIYEHYKVLRVKKKLSKLELQNSGSKNGSEHDANLPSFYTPVSPPNSVSIKPKFRIQFWETIPFFIFGLFSFIVLFEDRFVSWIYNDSTTTVLPFLFNPIYHMGADLSLVIVLAAGLIQYILLSPIYEKVYNKSIKIAITQAKDVNKLLLHQYKIIAMASIAISITLSIILYFVGPTIMSFIGGSKISLFVLHIASIANIMLSVFMLNSQFMIFTGKIKYLTMLVVAATVVNGTIGLKLGSISFEYAVFGYLAAAVMLFSFSLYFVLKESKEMANMYYGRFV